MINQITDFLLIPSYYKKAKKQFDFESWALKDFFAEEDSLEFLRFLYREDTQKFYITRDELLMRGISFREEYQNNFFPKLMYQIQNVIFIEENQELFKKINFKSIGLGNFIEQYHVSSDLFFHLMPFEGICNFAKDFSPTIIKTLFVDAGFNILSLEELDNVMKDKSFLNRNEKHQLDFDYSIENTFSEEKFTYFRNYCNQMNVVLFSELTLDFITEFANKDNIRNDIVRELIKKYEYKKLELAKSNIEIVNGNNVKEDKQQLEITMLKEIEDNISTFQKNEFRNFLERNGCSYFELINSIYEDETFDYSDNQLPLYKIKFLNNSIIKNIKAKYEEKLELEFENIRTALVNNEKFKYIAESKIKDVQDIFNLKVEDTIETNLRIIDTFNDKKHCNILKNINNVLKSFRMPKEHIEELVSQLKPNRIPIIKGRQLGLTLEQIGEQYEITRERVRQIIKKVNLKLSAKNSIIKISVFFQYYTQHCITITAEEFAKHLDIEANSSNYVILKELLSIDEKIFYIEKLDLYILREQFDYYIERLNSLNLNRAIIPFNEIKVIFEENIQLKIISNLIEKLMSIHGYIKGKEAYIRQSLSLTSRINYLFRNVIKEPLVMNDEGYSYFNSLMNEYFPQEFTSSKRAITARISDAEDTILVDNNTYYYHDGSLIDNKFVETIKNILNRHLEKMNFVDPRMIYQENLPLMEEYKIFSHVHLYSIINLYLDEYFDHSHGNSLYIYKKNEKVLDAESILIEYLNANSGEAIRESVLEDLKWKNFKLDQLLERIDSIIQVEDRKLCLISKFEFTDEEIQKLKEYVDIQFQNGYAFAFDLRFNMKNEIINILNSRNLLADEYSFMSILKWLNPNLRGYPKLLYLKDSPIQTIEQIISINFPDTITRKQIQDFIISYGYSEQTVYKVMFELIDKNYFYQYTGLEFINANQLNFTDSIILSLKTYLDEQFRNKVYLSALDLVGINSIAPIYHQGWSYHLIYELAPKVGYRQIPTNSDYRYNKLALVKESSNISNFEELVYYIVKNEYTGRNHEEDFAEFLMRKNLINNPKRLPSEIYESALFMFDRFGFFNLKEK
ncbi:sigma factor-like helix-turn-helix DNA-binding protein [Lysinibacillus halotolerans]|uniref:sigma factor-like helix-turn-helix DNA-binding protein n=1 Tax=Lysinibacillus halotolerans TaxID=1368476 RepID=UPI001313FB47|nr:sigma factor-like helix-turn-helix DNA-binding protein [Lysinibacillus halotolerans]